MATTTTKKKTTTAAKKKNTAVKKKPSHSKKKAAPTRLEPPKWTPIKKKRKKKQQPKAWHEKGIAEKIAYRKQNQGTILAVFAMAGLLLAAGFFEFCLIGYSFSALICLCLMGVVGFYTFFPKIFRHLPGFTRSVKAVFTILLCIGLLVFAATEVLVVRASFGSTDRDYDYLLVLGAKVRGDGVPSLSLYNRIDKAYEFLMENPDTVAILSGGQGPDEPMTEAKCMYAHLVEMGIDPERLWMEDKATSTWENMKYTLDLIEEKTGIRPGKLGVVSSEYHLFRASLFAGEHGVEFVGIPAETTRLSLKINYFLREVAGVWHYILLGGRYE